MSVFKRLALAVPASLLLAFAATAQPVRGQGATFPSKVYDTWAKAFEKAGGGAVAYKGTGSGDGIKQITARQVDFGGTDAPLPVAELARQHLVQIPMLVGGVVPVVNLPGLAAPLQLDGEPIERFDRVIAVYLGGLARDPATARLFLIESYAAGPDVARRRAEMQEQFLAGIVQIFGVRSDRGRFACRALLAAVISLATAAIATGDTDELSRLREPVVELARAGLAASV